MEESFQSYIHLASKNEDLKSDERVLSVALENIKEIKRLLIDKEKEFCAKDEEYKQISSDSTSVKETLQKRSSNHIEHLVHYKCIVECLSGEILSMENNLVNDDEYIHLSLIFRDVELAILQAIKVNQHRNELFMSINEDDAQSCLVEVVQKWRLEHQDRRKCISKLILDQNKFVMDKARANLEQQRVLLNQRYQSINSLIKMSYNHLSDGSTVEINKHHA